MAWSVFNYFGWYNKSGPALIGQEGLTLLSTFTLGITTGLTALAGGAQAGATQLNYGTNEVDTVVTTNDSTQLPLAILGAKVTVNNNGANTVRIYANAAPNTNNASTLDQIAQNAGTALTANATAITLASGYTAGFICSGVGVWKRLYAAS